MLKSQTSISISTGATRGRIPPLVFEFAYNIPANALRKIIFGTVTPVYCPNLPLSTVFP